MPTLQELLNVQNQQLDEINSLLNEEFLILKNKKAMALPEIEQKKAAVIDKIQKLDKVISEHPDCLHRQRALARSGSDFRGMGPSACAVPDRGTAFVPRKRRKQPHRASSHFPCRQLCLGPLPGS